MNMHIIIIPPLLLLSYELYSYLTSGCFHESIDTVTYREIDEILAQNDAAIRNMPRDSLQLIGDADIENEYIALSPNNTDSQYHDDIELALRAEDREVNNGQQNNEIP